LEILFFKDDHEINTHIAKLLLLVSSLLATTAYTQEAVPETTNNPKVKEDYQFYSKDGLSLKSPKDWSLAYDDNDAFYSDRAVAFNISEGNVVTVFIYNNPSKTTSNIADRYTRIIEPGSSEYVEDFSRSSITIGGYKGEKLRWKDTMLIPFTTEIIILQVTQIPPSVFVVFELLEKDIEKISPHITPVLNSITFTR
jgi:hypothetical protein